ncbi:MAG: purine-nucleoside phosphorylase [Actinomycetes bacterium]
MTAEVWAAAARSGALVQERLGDHTTAVVLGSGWAPAFAELGSTVAEIPVHELGLTAPGVPGHGGNARSVLVDDVPTLVLGGRIHLYDGHGVDAVCHAVRSAVLAGCSTVVLTNAAGSLRADLPVGAPVVVADHLNLTGVNPMIGPPPPGDPADRFVDLSDLYSAARRTAVRAAVPDLRDGVYAGLLGGSFETPAEIRMLAGMGADLVGMSTVLEAIAARHLGAEVIGLSLVTNLAAGLQDRIDHAEVLDVGRSAADHLAPVLHAAVTAR